MSEELEEVEESEYEGNKAQQSAVLPGCEETFYQHNEGNGFRVSVVEPDPRDNLSVILIATTDTSFEDCKFQITMGNDVKPKKKKGVGRIGFADVMVSEQVIKNTAEDLEMRRDHWRAIRDKADDPNTVFSNESSKSTSRAPSMHDSPEIRSLDGPLMPLVTENPILNFQLLLNEQLLKVMSDEQRIDCDLAPLRTDASPTLPSIEDNEKIETDFGDAGCSAEKKKSLYESEGTNSNKSIVGSECMVLGMVSEIQSGAPQINQVESNLKEIDSGNKLSKIFGVPAQVTHAVLETNDIPLPLSDIEIKVKSDQKKLQEPPGVGCPLLDFPDLNSYISQKQEHDVFSEMSQALLAYIDLWPKARKAPRNGVFPPRDIKTSKDFAYALQRWLVRTWHSGIKLQNSYHIGILMNQDKDLLHGQNPLIEKNLVSKLENDHELSVQLTAVADITVDDWIEISSRFKNRHLIGGNFFPSDEYSVLSGLDALRLSTSQVLKEEEDAQLAADVVRGSAAVLWEADSSIGLPMDFRARTDHAAWDEPYPLRLTRQGIAVDDKENTVQVNMPAQHEEKRGRPNGHLQTNAAARKPVPSALQRRQGLELGRAISEPLPRSSRHARGDDGAKLRRPATSEILPDQALNKCNTSEKNRKLEADLDFQRFTKSKTGRTKLSQQKLDMLKFAYRDDILHRRKVQAAKTVSILLADTGDSLVRSGEGDSSDASGSGKVSHVPRSTADPSRFQNGVCTAKLMEKMESGKSNLTVIESAFSKKIKANDYFGFAKMESCDSPDRYSDAEENIDEFLRGPMCKLLLQDNLLAKSLNVTGFGEDKSKQPEVNDHKNSLRQHSSQPSRFGPQLQFVAHQDDHHGPSIRLPDLRNRAANRMKQVPGQRCDGLLRSMRLAGKLFPGRRSAQSALGYLDHHPLVDDLVKSPYTQRVRGSFSAHRISKPCEHKSRAAQAVV